VWLPGSIASVESWRSSEKATPCLLGGGSGGAAGGSGWRRRLGQHGGSGSRRTGVAVARHWREVLLALARAGAAATLCTLGLQTARMAAIAGGGLLDGTVLQRSTAKSGLMVLHMSPRCDTCGTAFPPGAVR
jgi:hypothetical protein